MREVKTGVIGLIGTFNHVVDGVESVLDKLTDSSLVVTDKSSPDGRGGRIGITRNTFNMLGGYRDDTVLADDDALVIRAMQLGKKLIFTPCKITPIPNKQ